MRIAGPLAVSESRADRTAQPGVALIRGQLDVDIPRRMIAPDQRLEDLCSMGFGVAIVSTLTAHTSLVIASILCNRSAGLRSKS